MKAKLWSICLLAMILISVVGCGGKTEPSPYREGDFDTSGDVVLRIEHPVYDKSVASFHYYVENHTDRELIFGAPYTIEVQRGGEWQSLPPAENVGWNDIAYVLQPGGEWSNAFSFFAYEYEVDDGRYRLIKEIGGKYYTAEFTIGQSDITAEHPFGYDALEELPEELDLAALDYDLLINAAGEVAGGSEEQVMAFLEQVSLRSPAMLRMVSMGLDGEVVLYDVIYQDDHFLCRRDNTRGNSSAIEEHRYAFLVADEESVYLCDAVSLDKNDLSGRSITADRYAIMQKNWFSDWDGIAARVEQLKETQLENSVVLARFWNEEGTYWLDLTGEPMDYLVSTKGYGMGRTLTECESERELEIVSVRWENAAQVRLLCREKGGQENSREPGWYAVFDTGKEQVVSHGRSMWVSSMAPDGITR